MSLPRIITVDPTWSISRILNAVLDLTERTALQVDVPDGANALRELKAGCNLMLMSFQVDEGTKGWELAARVHKQSPDTAIIVLGDLDDPEEFDEETMMESPYVYLRRPVDPQRFLRVISAGMDGGDVKAAMSTSSAPVAHQSMGSVPAIDLGAAQNIMERLLIDVGAMALILATRTGEVLIERGAVGYINRERLANALTPSLLTSIDVKDLVGGQLYTIQFFDGDEYDLFVMSVGLHHFLCAVFDGQSGSRQFGNVNRYGRRAVEDLIALIGANAFFIERVAAPQPEQRRTRTIPKVTEKDEEALPLERAVLGETAPAAPEPVPTLEPISADIDELAALLSGDLGDLKAENADDLFDIDSMEQLVNENLQNQKGKLGWEDAKKIGLF